MMVRLTNNFVNIFNFILAYFSYYHFWFLSDLLPAFKCDWWFNMSVTISFALYIWIKSCTKYALNVILIKTLTYETSSFCLRVHKNNSQYSERNSTELLLFCTSEYRPTYDPTLLMTLSTGSSCWHRCVRYVLGSWFVGLNRLSFKGPNMTSLDPSVAPRGAIMAAFQSAKHAEVWRTVECVCV